MQELKIDYCFSFKGTMNPDNCSNPSIGDVVYDVATGKTYAYIGNDWDCISDCISEPEENKESKVINLECKHCGASSFTKIRSKHYKCDYCDSILIYE